MIEFLFRTSTQSIKINDFNQTKLHYRIITSDTRKEIHIEFIEHDKLKLIEIMTELNSMEEIQSIKINGHEIINDKRYVATIITNISDIGLITNNEYNMCLNIQIYLNIVNTKKGE